MHTATTKSGPMRSMGISTLTCVLLVALIGLTLVCEARGLPRLPAAGTDARSDQVSAEALADMSNRPAKGVFLVASRTLLDPNFYRSVVLLTAYGSKGAMGLVVNHPTQIKLSEVFPEVESLRRSSEVIYRGGPVASHRVLILFRSPSLPPSAAWIFDDVYMSANQALLDKLIQEGKRLFRLYAGHAGWAPGQLEMEIARGGWYVLPADAALVFSEAPSKTWQRLMDRLILRSVRAERGMVVRTGGRADHPPDRNARHSIRLPGRLAQPVGDGRIAAR